MDTRPNSIREGIANSLRTYINDPEGETCYGGHDSHLCQYEIHKAIVSIKKGWLFSHARFNN